MNNLFPIQRVVAVTEKERKVLEVLIRDFDDSGWDETGYYAFKSLQRATKLSRRLVRLACRSLTRKGLAQYKNALWSDDGPAGAGYGATQKGVDFFTALLATKQ